MRLRWWPVLVLVSAWLAFGAGPGLAATNTVVSLTFDDDRGDQYDLRSLLTSHGMDATFFVNSGTVGAFGNLTWDQLHDLAADGNEVTGHTIDHVDLTTVDATEARRQVCDDRKALFDHGFQPTNFAFPYGARNDTVKAIVRDCGYNSARRAWGLWSPANCPFNCPYAETIPPADVYAIKTSDSIQADTSLSTIESYITQAEDHGGGWVPLVFHHLCTGCDPYSITVENLTAFLDWLQARSTRGTVVKTVQQVVGGPVQPPPGGADTTPPTSSIACNGGTCSTGWYTSAVQVTLSATDGGSGVAAIRYTTDGSDPTATSTLYGGPFAVSQTTTVKYRAWDNAGNVEAPKSQTIRIDATAPTAAISSPAAGTTVTGTIKVIATADDAGAGVATVTFYLDGGPSAGQSLGTSTTSPYRVTWNTRKVSKGQHTLTAVAVDGAGNSTTSPPVTITVG
jgi:Bacterial Ig domain/Polysaccharide deacetylase/Chitobiase/beta-hexosaminidase C-terminal domain